LGHKTTYTFSFTGATALIPETLAIAEEFQQYGDWQVVQKLAFDGNLMKKVKEATFKREFREIKKRLTSLTSTQLGIMVNGDLNDAKAMILLSLVKIYPFFKDFLIEVLLNKYLSFETTLNETDYNRFYNNKCLSHIELNQLTESTAQKVKQRTFTMLAQTDIITNVHSGIIIRPILSSDSLDAILNDDPELLSAFLFSNEEIKTLLQKLKHA
jgi:hypothetical protein